MATLITLEPNSFPSEDVCFFCGRVFTSGFILAHANIGGKLFGYVCPECLKTGPDGIRKRMLERSEQMLRRAQHFRILCTQKIECPTWEEWEEANRREEEFMTK